MGVPASRCRRLSFVIGRWLIPRLIACPRSLELRSIYDCGPVETFRQALHPDVSADIYYFMGASETRASLAAYMEKRGWAPESDTAPIMAKDILTGSQLRYLEGYMAKHEENMEINDSLRTCPSTIWNLLQRPEYFYTAPKKVMPTLLCRCSKLWSLQRQRWLFPEEALAVMGLGLPAKEADGHISGIGENTDEGDLSWPALPWKTLRSFTHVEMEEQASQLYRFAGNGVHVAIIGSMLMWALCTFHKEPVLPQAKRFRFREHSSPTPPRKDSMRGAAVEILKIPILASSWKLRR